MHRTQPLERLETRLVLAATNPHDVVLAAMGDHVIGPASVAGGLAGRHELVVVDGSLANVSTLLADIGAASAERSVLVVAPGTPVADLATYFQGRPEAFDAIHVVSHGGPGWIALGGQHFQLGDGGHDADLWAGMGSSLVVVGDLLLYGCNVGSGSEGRTSVERLAQITGADVAASTDLTGGANGDWVLEQHVGAVEAQSLEPAMWQGVLTGITVSNVCVNEGSPYAVWTINYTANAQVMLELTDGTASVATDLLGSGSKLQYLSGSTWADYTAGTAVSVDGTGKLLVRVAINNDTPFENVETLQLTISQSSQVNNISGVTFDVITDPNGNPFPVLDRSKNLVQNGDFTVGNWTFNQPDPVGRPELFTGNQWSPGRTGSSTVIPGWTASGGGSASYGNVRSTIAGPLATPDGASLPYVYFGNGVFYTQSTPVFDFNTAFNAYGVTGSSYT